MKKAKKERLEAAGWKIGSVQDFLELSDEEALLIEMKLAIARRVRTTRRSRKLTQERLAKLLKTSQSRVAKIEAADPSVSFEAILKALVVLGAKPKEIGKAMALST